jgi:hypothetical protein
VNAVNNNEKPVNMKTRLLTNPLAPNSALREIAARIPEQADVDNLQVGDMAPTCFGGLARVTRIYARSKDIHGRSFVCYYAAMNERDTAENGCGCSTSMKVGELIRTVALTGRLNSAECDALENDMHSHSIPMRAN